MEWKGGKLVRAVVRPTRPGECRVRAHVPLSIRAEGRAVPPARPEPGITTFPVEAGKSYALTP